MYRNDLRWVCQWHNKNGFICDGTFRPSGYGGKRGTRCRLFEKCHGADPQLETYHQKQYRGQKQLRPPPDKVQSRAHDIEQIALRRCFDPHCRDGETAKRYAEKPWAFKRKPKIGDLVPGYVPLTAAKEIPPPPCGGDCMNCPSDDGCLYPNWDEDHRKDRTAKRRANAKYEAKIREQRKTDPELDAKVRARSRAYAKKARAKLKYIKAGGDPAKFEVLWALQKES